MGRVLPEYLSKWTMNKVRAGSLVHIAALYFVRIFIFKLRDLCLLS